LNSTALMFNLGESTSPFPGLTGRLGVVIGAPSIKVLLLEGRDSPGGPKGAKVEEEMDTGLDCDHGLAIAVMLVLLDILRCHKLGDALGLPLPILIVCGIRRGLEGTDGMRS
jgi:hypothetical protein